MKKSPRRLQAVGVVFVRGRSYRLCEHSALTVIGLFFISLTRVKEMKQRKRVQGDSKSPCKSPGLCAFCTYEPKAVREAASQKPRGLAVLIANTFLKGFEGVWGDFSQKSPRVPPHAMIASISATVRGMAAERSMQPSSVISTSFSMRTPMPSSAMYIPGSTVITMPGLSVRSRSVQMS